MSSLPGYPALLWACFFLSFLVCSTYAENQNIPPNASQVIYTPYLCNPTPDTSNPCDNTWHVTPGNTNSFVSLFIDGQRADSSGPSTIHQMFLQFQGSAFQMNTSAQSTAIIKITVANNASFVAQQFNSSVGVVSILHLHPDEISTVALTIVSSQFDTRLDITSLTVVADDKYPIFPTPTLPSSVPAPTMGYTSSSTASSQTPVANSSKLSLTVEAVSITLGLSLGLTAIAVTAYICWRRRKRRNSPSSTDSETLPSLAPEPLPHRHARRMGGNGGGGGGSSSRRYHGRRMGGRGQKERQFFGWSSPHRL